jgi:hypothetical protein
MAKADWDAGLIWLPKGIDHNPPDNPNVVKSWRHYWDDVPECPLKLEAYQTLRERVAERGEGFANAFANSIRNPYPNGIDNRRANQEQDLEQEQEQECMSPKGAKTPKRKLTLCDERYEPSPAVLEWAAKRGIGEHQLKGELARMRDWSQANNKKKRDWDAALRNWLRDKQPRQTPKRQQDHRSVEQGLRETIYRENT